MSGVLILRGLARGEVARAVVRRTRRGEPDTAEFLRGGDAADQIFLLLLLLAFGADGEGVEDAIPLTLSRY
jgi:hypothetical protein